MNKPLLSPLVLRHNAWRGPRIILFPLFVVLLTTPLLPAQDSKASKIPEGEAQFTEKQLEQYYLVYKNSDVRYLRTLFDAYLNNSGGTAQELQPLHKWSKDYFRSKFVVLSRANGMFGGTWTTILFQDRPDKVFSAWVYAEGDKKKLVLRAFDDAKFSDEDIRRTRIRYKKLIEDKEHAI